MSYTRLNKQKLRGLHLAALAKAAVRSFKADGTLNVKANSIFKRSVH
jgi:hypothetical protein